MKTALLISLILVAGCESNPQDTAVSSAPDCNVIHRPERGCPAGYQMETYPRFTERDGTKEFACVTDDPAKEPCVDVLKPGETMHILLFPTEPEKPAKADDRSRA